MPEPGALAADGVLAQMVLAEGGHRQAIVEIGGRQSFVDDTSGTNSQPGDLVRIVIPIDELLLYHGEALVDPVRG